MTPPPRVLVTGSREWTDMQAIAEWLGWAREVFGKPKPLVVAHGGAWSGADDMVDVIYNALKSSPTPGDAEILQVERFPVLPYVDGPWPAAGPLRNERMLDAFKPSLVLAFILPDLPNRKRSAGTLRCVEAAEKRGIQICRIFGDDAPRQRTGTR